MHEIIFRGKRIDNGEWVYGLPFAYQAVLDVEGIETWDGEKHRIDPSTVGQFTGLCDKNGTQIFEGDVVNYRGLKDLVVAWNDGALWLIREDTLYALLDHYTSEFVTVIGIACEGGYKDGIGFRAPGEDEDDG